MCLAFQNTEDDKTQRTYARLAGFLLLAVIVLAIGSGFVLSRIEGSGNFAEAAMRIAASQHLYRAALSAAVVVSLASALLAFALYATLKPVNTLLAQLGMIFSLCDSFLALIVRTCSFVEIHLQLSSQVSAESLSELMRTIANTTENLGGISFGIGSFLFFYLFFQSRYIPKIISILGICASALWTGLYFGNLIFPEQHKLFMEICFPPMALAEIATGLYLLLFAIRTQGRIHLDQQTSIPG